MGQNEYTFIVARLGTHASGLVHIDPGAVNVQTGLRIVEELELVGPVALCLGIEPV